MANELLIPYPTGATLYALLYDATGNVWNGSAFAAPSSANWLDYDIAMTEVATATGIYRASMPAVAAGVYGWTVRRQAGGSPAVGDIAVGTGRIEWSGTAEVSLTSRASAADLASTNTTVDDIFDDVGDVRTVVDNTYVRLGPPAGASMSADIAAIAADVATIDNSGAYSYTDTIDDGSGNLLDGVFVQLATDDGFTNIVTTTHSNASGAFTVRSDQAGTHYLRLQLAGIEFSDQTVVLA